jgi:hypothetical protein
MSKDKDVQTRDTPCPDCTEKKASMYIDENLIKRAAEDAKADKPKDKDKDKTNSKFPKGNLRAEDVLPNNTLGAAADYLAPSSWGATRAGRATQLGEAADATKDVGFPTRYPMTSTMLAGIPASLAGGFAGAYAGDAIDSQDGGLLGALAGAGLGMAGGSALMSYLRRRNFETLARKFNEKAEAGDISNSPPDVGGMGTAAFLPFGGPHRAGQADSYTAIASDKPPETSIGRNLGYLLQNSPWGGGILQQAQGGMQSINAKNRIDAASGATRLEKAPKRKNAW